MRILLTSDLHYKLRQYDWVIGAASRFDAVVIAGDHLDTVLPVPSIVQIAALSASFAAVAQKSRLFVCSGNHDLNAHNEHGERSQPEDDQLEPPTETGDGLAVHVFHGGCDRDDPHDGRTRRKTEKWRHDAPAHEDGNDAEQ